MSLMYKCVTGGNQGMTNFDVKLVILVLFKFWEKNIMLWGKKPCFFRLLRLRSVIARALPNTLPEKSMRAIYRTPKICKFLLLNSPSNQVPQEQRNSHFSVPSSVREYFASHTCTTMSPIIKINLLFFLIVYTLSFPQESC